MRMCWQAAQTDSARHFQCTHDGVYQAEAYRRIRCDEHGKYKNGLTKVLVLFHSHIFFCSSHIFVLQTARAHCTLIDNTTIEYFISQTRCAGIFSYSALMIYRFLCVYTSYRLHWPKRIFHQRRSGKDI